VRDARSLLIEVRSGLDRTIHLRSSRTVAGESKASASDGSGVQSRGRAPEGAQRQADSECLGDRTGAVILGRSQTRMAGGPMAYGDGLAGGVVMAVTAVARPTRVWTSSLS
jgi:hypothetical protein